MAESYARGSQAWGLCQKCGFRFLLNQLRLDGYYPNLRVCPECFDTRHPQEDYVDVSDPQALWRPSPDTQPVTAPVLAASWSIAGAGLSWTGANFVTRFIASYDVYVSLDAGLTWSLLAHLPTVTDEFGALKYPVLSYADATTSTLLDRSYYVKANASGGAAVLSNIVSLPHLQDPYFYNVTLLMHCDVAGPYIDSSSYAHTITSYGGGANEPLDTIIKKFGAGSASFPSGVSTLTIPDAPEFNLSTGDWTVEVQVNPNAAHDGFGVRPILNKRTPGITDQPPFDIRLNATNNLSATGAGPSTNYTISGPVVPSGTWAYISLDRRGNTMTLRVNGVSAGTATISGALGNPAQPIEIGGMQNEGNNFGGNIDEVRITKGVSRDTSVPPIAAFPNG